MLYPAELRALRARRYSTTGLRHNRRKYPQKPRTTAGFSGAVGSLPVTPSAPITLCGSLSRYPVSLGAAMHLAGYRALGLSFTYVPFAVEDLEGALAGMRALRIRGFGVSMPYKLDVIPLLDRLDPLAARIGAVNTIVNDDGTLAGHNTDAWGAARALSEVMELQGRHATIIGAGGAARAVAYSLKQEGMRLHIVNRTPEKAERLADGLGVSAGALDSVNPEDAVINCSSAGMSEYGASSPLASTCLRPGLVVMDIVYKPVRTRLLAEAEAAGATTVSGARMLLHQACRQFELYTGQEAPLTAMDDALRQQLE